MKKGYQLVYKWYDIFKHAIFEPECYYKFNFQIDTCFIIMTNFCNMQELLEDYHLYCGDVLLLLHIDMGNVEPDITEVSCGLTNLGEHVSSLVNTALVSQNTACK